MLPESLVMPLPKNAKQARELDSERIATAAMKVLDKCGAPGFTMRAVADALKVTPMALYHHVGDKSGLVALLVDAAMNEVELPKSSGDWRQDIWVMSTWIRQVILAHPALSLLRREHKVWTAAIFQLAERWLGLWQQSGLPLEKAILAARTSSTAITGFVVEELIQQEIQFPDKKSLSMLPNARALFDKPENQEKEFELAVKAMIDGIYQRLVRD